MIAMKSISKILMLSFVLQMLVVWTINAQTFEYYKSNKDAVAIYEKLDSLFPLCYMHVKSPYSERFRIEKKIPDAENISRYREDLEDVFKILDGQKTYKKYIEQIDSADIYKKKYVMSLVTEISGQKDYLSLDFSNKGVFYNYTINKDEKYFSANMPVKESTMDALIKLRDEYLARKRVKYVEVDYDWSRNYGRDYMNGGLTTGFKYVIPDCNKTDYDRFCDLFYDLSNNDYVHVASNDVYNWFNECVIYVIQKNRKPMFFAVALVGSNLYMVCAEGECEDRGSLPVAWVYDFPNWQYNLRAGVAVKPGDKIINRGLKPYNPSK